jgi:general secretion pathway protein G
MTRAAFTLIELIVVIAIISVLGAIIAPNAFRAIEKAKCTRAISEAKTIQTAAFSYYGDTGIWPTRYRLTDTLNPFITNPNVTGWDGPYVEKWLYAHPWAGHIGWDPTIDLDGSGMLDGCVVFDDDRVGTGAGDNVGRIPRPSMIRIDSIIDDGSLASGHVQGDGQGLASAVGELVIMVVRDNGVP